MLLIILVYFLYSEEIFKFHVHGDYISNVLHRIYYMVDAQLIFLNELLYRSTQQNPLSLISDHVTMKYSNVMTNILEFCIVI